MRPTISRLHLFLLAAVSVAMTRPASAMQCSGGSIELLSQAPDQNDGFLSDDSTDAFGRPASNVEDFVLRQGMRVSSLRVWGFYWPSGNAVPDNFTVIVHADDGGNVGPLVRRENGVQSTRSATGAQVSGLDEYEYVLQLARPLSLPPGTYWIEIFNRTGDGAEDWLWETGIADGANGSPGHRVDGDDAPGTLWHTSPWDLALSICGEPVDPDPSFVTQYPDSPGALESDASCSSCSTGAMAVADDFLLSDRTAVRDVVVFGTYGPGVSYYEDRFTLLLHEDDAGQPGDPVYVEQGIHTARHSLRTEIGVEDVFRYVLTMDAPVDLEPGRYWLQVYNDTYGSNVDWEWMDADPDPDHGFNNCFVAFEAPGADWVVTNLDDRAFELRGRLVDPPPVLVHQTSDFQVGLPSDEDCDQCVGDDHASAENVRFTESVTLEDILFRGFYSPGNEPDAGTFTLVVHRDSGGLPGAILRLEANLHVNRATTDQETIGNVAFLYHLVPRSPIPLAAGTYWFEIFGDSSDTLATWYWSTGTADGTHGIPGSADSEQAPGSTWNARAEDLALVLRGRSGLGQVYCTATANSTGAPAAIDASGSASVSAADLTLHSAPVPNQASVFFHGTNQVQIPFGDGFLCTSGDVRRGRVVHAAGGSAAYIYDNSHPRRSLAGLEGTTRNFQHWFRDPMGGGAGFNTSNAIAIGILP